MVLEDCPMAVLNLLLILKGCIEKLEEGTESSAEAEEEESSLDSLLVVSTFFTAIFFGYKGNKV